MPEPVPVSIAAELKSDFLSYSTAIYNRSLPDIVDGLKVAQRRVLLGMTDLRLSASSQFLKVSRLEGHVLGTLHPQGGCSGTIINLGQESAQRYTLTQIHGNAGGTIQTGNFIGQMVSEDPPAAARYLEVRSTEVCDTLYLSQVDRSLGNWRPNYDGTRTEAVRIVPSLPALLLTGAVGIASGYACNHMPWALPDIVKATTALIRNPKLTDSQLLAKFSNPPEPPAGGRIVKDAGVSQALLTGKGQITSYGEWQLDNAIRWGKRSTRPALTVTRLASGSSEKFLERVRDLAEAEKLPGLLDAADYSSRDGIRIVLVAKTVDQRDNILVELLRAGSGLKATHNVNAVAVTLEGVPRTIGVREAITQWYRERQTYLVQKYTKEIEELSGRLERLDSIMKVLNDVDKFLSVVRGGKDKEATVLQVAKVWKLSREMASYVLGIPISSLIRTEKSAVEKDREKVRLEIDRLEELSSPGAKLDAHICDQIASLRPLGGPRRAVWMTERVPETPKTSAGGEKPNRIKEEAQALGISTRALNKWLKENLGKGDIYTLWEDFKHKRALSSREGKKAYAETISKIKKNSGLPSRGKHAWNAFTASLPDPYLPPDKIVVYLTEWKTRHGISSSQPSPGPSANRTRRGGSTAKRKPSKGSDGSKPGPGDGTPSPKASRARGGGRNGRGKVPGS